MSWEEYGKRSVALPVDDIGTSCIGPKDASHFAIYLHGLDRPIPSGQERGIRRSLEAIAQELNMIIALPRATMVCPDKPGLRAWVWGKGERDAKTMRAALRGAIESGVESCFPNQKKFGVLGFSNGGLVVNGATRYCMDVGASWLVAVGAPGTSWSNSDLTDLSGCARSAIITGKNDEYHYLDGVEQASEMYARGADVILLEHDGGHEVPRKLLRDTLEVLIHSEKSSTAE